MKLLQALQIVLIATLLIVMSYLGYLTYKEAKVYETAVNELIKEAKASLK